MKKLLLFSLVVLSVRYSNAQWVVTGPLNSEGFIYCLNVSGHDVLAGTDNGPFISSDDGNNWNPVDSGIPIELTSNYSAIGAFAINGSDIFAAGPGMFLSTNDGSYWKWLSDTDTTINLLILSGTNLFAVTYSNNVYLSADSGRSWTPKNNGLTGGAIISLAVSGDNIFIGTYEGGVFLSTDTGNNWIAVNNGLKSNVIYSLYSFNYTLYAATDSGVFLSTDNGNNWSFINDGLVDMHDNIYGVTCFTMSGNYLFAGTAQYGVFLFDSNTNKWTPVNSGFSQYPPYLWISTLLINDSILFAGVNGEIWQLPLTALTGLREIQSSSLFQVYPNPTSSTFTIQTSATGSPQLQLFDITGHLLLTQSLSNKQTTINASGLEAGVYLVSLKNNEGVNTQKMVIAR